MRYKNFLFDLDGTLVDSYMGVTNAVLHSLTYYPEIPTPKREDLRVFIGPPLYNSYTKYFGMDDKTAHEAIARYREYYSVTGKYECTFFDGLRELLEALKQKGGKVVMATSKPTVFAKDIAKHHDIEKYFDYICGADIGGPINEKEQVIEHLFDISGYEKNESVMIGDTVFDVRGAKINGIDCVTVTYGYGTRDELEKSGAVSVLDTVAELSEFLLCD